MIYWMIFEFVDLLSVTGLDAYQLLTATAQTDKAQILIAEIGSKKGIVALYRCELEDTSRSGKVSIFDRRGRTRLFRLRKAIPFASGGASTTVSIQ